MSFTNLSISAGSAGRDSAIPPSLFALLPPLSPPSLSSFFPPFNVLHDDGAAVAEAMAVAGVEAATVEVAVAVAVKAAAHSGRNLDLRGQNHISDI